QPASRTPVLAATRTCPLAATRRSPWLSRRVTTGQLVLPHGSTPPCRLGAAEACAVPDRPDCADRPVLGAWPCRGCVVIRSCSGCVCFGALPAGRPGLGQACRPSAPARVCRGRGPSSGALAPCRSRSWLARPSAHV